jgi:hypothetical protein
LTEAAQVAARAQGTYLAAHHAQIRGRRGTYKAMGAIVTTSSLLIVTSFVIGLPTMMSDQTGMTGNDPLINKLAGSCANWKNSE